MKYILTLLLSAGIVFAQNPPQPAKILVGGNNSVSMGQVVAGYSNDFHIGIRIPLRTNVVSVNNDQNEAVKPLYPNPCEGISTFSGDIRSIEVVDIFGNRITDAVDFHNKTINVNRGTYFVNMVNASGTKHSTVLISK